MNFADGATPPPDPEPSEDARARPHDLAARAEAAHLGLRACRLCPRQCGVDRLTSSRGAFCRLDAQAWVYKELLSVGEEQPLGPTWLIDLGGCSLRCLFCSEWAHVADPQRRPAVPLRGAWLIDRARSHKAAGALSVSFVGGDPTVSLAAVLDMLARQPSDAWLPVVWNCNGWLSTQARELLAGVVACWIIDLKFGPHGCSSRLAGAAGIDNHAEVAASLDFAIAESPLESNLPPLIVRHLVMPGHLTCCTRPALDWLARRHPDTMVNVMTGYLPLGPAATGRLRAAGELHGRLTGSERDAAVSHARQRFDRVLVDGRPDGAPPRRLGRG